MKRFSSIKGPGSGRLACVWAVRSIIYEALHQWITRTDSTSELVRELNRCLGHGSEERNVPAGGIVVSPTTVVGKGKVRHGHVGLLGEQPGTQGRLIFSNSSRDALWEQNYNLSSWNTYFNGKLHLDVLFYPLPQRDLK